jgi:hypothetical protein
MESDPQTRRAGMRFPNFWLIFFECGTLTPPMCNS